MTHAQSVAHTVWLPRDASGTSQVVYSVLMANMGLDAAAFALCTRENLQALRRTLRLPCSCCRGARGGERGGGAEAQSIQGTVPLAGRSAPTHASAGRGIASVESGLEASPLLPRQSMDVSVE